MTPDDTAALPAAAAAALDCHAAVRRLWDYLDDELAAGDRAALDAHLAACGACPPHFEFERAFLAAMAASADATAPDGTPAAGLSALRHRVTTALAADLRGRR